MRSRLEPRVSAEVAAGVATLEAMVAARLEAAWGCRVHHFGRYDHVDWWLEKDGATWAYAELKTSTRLPTETHVAWLSHRKWVALTMAGLAGPAPLFVVGFRDGTVKWINAYSVDLTGLRIDGRSDRGYANDWEPIIVVPLSAMEDVP